jgi:hypothetical protein
MRTISTTHWAWLLAAIGLVGLSWNGSLDTVSGNYVNASIVDAGIIYGTARGINALVSALQGTELDMWLVTFSVGELLDPINDMIERFSGVMTWAITALVIQKLLLAIVSDTVFSIVLTALAVGGVIAFLINRTLWAQWLLRGFLVVAFLRFSLALVVLANLWVDHSFLPDSSSDEHRLMQEFYWDLEGVDAIVRGDEEQMAAKGKTDACPWHQALSDNCKEALADQFELIRDQFAVFVDGSLRLLGAILLKSVIIPLLFLYALLQVARGLFRGLSAGLHHQGDPP